jgi:hypothetical protein
MKLIDHRSHQARVPITASMLYALVTRPHRVTMDLFADPADRDFRGLHDMPSFVCAAAG